MAEETRRTSSPEKAGRSSFSSIRENDSGLAQTFTSSKVSSYTLPEDAVEEQTPPKTMMAAEFAPPLTLPHSRLHGSWYPVDGFKGWKQINVRGKLASKSHGDLVKLHMDWEPSARPADNGPAEQQPPSGEGMSIIESLPQEIINSILEYLVLDVPPNGIDRRNVDLISVLQTSRQMYMATLPTIYAHVTIPHSRIFQKFLAQISAYPELGKMVRRLDFSHFNPNSLFTTASERSMARNLTSETLLRCLELTPNLQEFLAQEYIDEDIGADVIKKLFTGLEKMEAVDFCGCSSAAFKAAFSSADLATWPKKLGIKRLSLHRCLTLPSSVLDGILPRLANVTHLDIAGTKVTNAALRAIPTSAQLTHLNLAKCNLLAADNVINFCSSHDAARRNLVFLSLAMDKRSHEMLDTSDVTRLLHVLPRTLKSLNLIGSRMEKSHIQQMRPLIQHLEELALGTGLEVEDIDGLFYDAERKTWNPHGLKFLDLTDTSDLLSSLYRGSVLLGPHTSPLDVIEVSEPASRKVKLSENSLKSHGWRLQELNARSWLVRNVGPNEPRDDGARAWKWGAQYWGMRKVPVARAEVGGMYGSYMFGRKL